MCYCATHPEKLDATKQQQWQKLAMLSEKDMNTITNLEFIGVPVRKRSKATGLNFGRKRKRAVRKAGSPHQPHLGILCICGHAWRTAYTPGRILWVQ